LREATDVNNAGWITGFGRYNVPGQDTVLRSFLLHRCSPDVDNNGVVNVDDLFVVINAWGPCDDPDDCPADIDGNKVVNVDDLFAILNNWGPCYAQGSQTPPQGIYDCLQRYSDPERIQACIDTMILTGTP
jgi:hypothetical protein